MNFYSNIMGRRKKDGSMRCILNLSQLNEYVVYDKFKLETLNHAVHLMRPNSWFASVDIFNAYYAFLIDSSHRPFFRFHFQGQLWEFIGAPQGYCRMPYIFTKVLKVPLGFLRSHSVQSVIYLDDIFLTDSNFDKLKQDIFLTVSLLDRLGFTLNLRKSVLVPVQEIEFLGFLLDSKSMLVRPTHKKCTKIKAMCTGILSRSFITIRELSQIIGTFVAVSSGVEFGVTFYTRLEILRNKALKASKGQWDSCIPVCATMREDLTWWLMNIDSAYKAAEPRPFTITIYTDACSDKGWGGVCDERTATGAWDANEALMHINCKELLAAIFCLKSFVKTSGHHVRLFTDNATMVACINRRGSTKSRLNDLTRELCQWCIDNDNRVTAMHIPGKDNVVADRESRLDKRDIEWQLNKSVFDKVNRIFGPFEIDLFASRLNNQVANYVSWKCDPGAWAIDALLVDWQSLRQMYAFPPFSLLPAVFQKMDREKVDVLVILPLWTTQSWWPQMLQRLIIVPIVLDPRKRVLIYPQYPELKHPLFPQTKLLACPLSGNAWKAEVFRATLPLSSSLLGDQPPGSHMRRTSESGYTFAVGDKLITCAPLSTYS